MRLLFNKPTFGSVPLTHANGKEENKHRKIFTAKSLHRTPMSTDLGDVASSGYFSRARKQFNASPHNGRSRTEPFPCRAGETTQRRWLPPASALSHEQQSSTGATSRAKRWANKEQGLWRHRVKPARYSTACPRLFSRKPPLSTTKASNDASRSCARFKPARTTSSNPGAADWDSNVKVNKQ